MRQLLPPTEDMLGRMSRCFEWRASQILPERRRKFSAEFKDEAVRMVIETSRPVAEVAREIQVNEGTLGSWVAKYRAAHAGDEPPLTVSERVRLRGLERENRELRMKAEFLGKTAAFFARGYR
jgi:transposase